MNQCELVIEYMEERGSITPIDAMNDLGVMRLASRISDLRQQGYAIETVNETKKNRFGENTTYARYYLKEVQPNESN